MKKDMFHATKKCGGLYSVEYDDNIPFLLCNKCGHKVDDWFQWNSKYSKFFLSEERWLDKKDHIVCLLGHFNSLYNKFYGINYTLSLNENGLFRGPEVSCIRRMYRMFDCNAIFAKNYITWVFDTKVGMRKRKITSLGFLVTATLVSEYKMARLKSGEIGRSTPLPTKLIEWIRCKNADLLAQMDLRDHGDLHMLLTHYKSGLINNDSASLLIEKLKGVGYITNDYTIKNWRE